MTTPRPGAGDLVLVTRAASVQFVTPIMFRVIRVLDRVTFDGWIWLDGYQLDRKGDAVARRSIFVQPAGLRVQQRAATPRRPTTLPTVRQNCGPAGLPPATPQRQPAQARRTAGHG
ncbi:hypothetical protein [Micromonospora sp. NBRC 101691]|uniref:hypothetical protein n=1 Tax=Micromonospora sp. NBRC 101691 TaxID=3032198 RepID=UPI0024A48BF8|nr:hypothetical protein [Micromonospora sp. NBRC 101691]GLY23046.1 hypothetical protein Misp04_27780 [Micromonospora sp. NBRC 101691]